MLCIAGKFGDSTQTFGEKVWQMNRSAKRLLIVSWMISVWQVMNDSPTSC